LLRLGIFIQNIPFSTVYSVGEFQMVSPQPIPLPTGHLVVNPMEKQLQGL
jgi:hypothetical protein